MRPCNFLLRVGGVRGGISAAIALFAFHRPLGKLPMRFSLDTDENRYLIKSYGPGWIAVNDQKIFRSAIIAPKQLSLDWPPQTFADLEEAHFEMIAALKPEIVLLGTGSQLRFPHPRLTQPLLALGIGIEIMDITAACRTYNVIMLEGRQVAAALLLMD